MTLDQLINDAIFIRDNYNAGQRQVVYAGPHYVQTGGQREVADRIHVSYDMRRHEHVVLIGGEGMTPCITSTSTKRRRRSINKKK